MDRTIQHCTKKCQKGYESALFCYYPNKDRHAEATIKCSFNLLCIMSLHKTSLQEIVCASNVQCPGNPRSLLGKRELVEYEFETTGSNRAQTLPAFHEGAFLRRTFVDQVKTGTTNFLSNFKSVSNPPDRFNILRLRRIKLDLFPDLLNMHRNRSNISHRLHIPDLPE